MFYFLYVCFISVANCEPFEGVVRGKQPLQSQTEYIVTAMRVVQARRAVASYPLF